MATLIKEIEEEINKEANESRIEYGTAPIGKKMSEIFDKVGRWKKDAKRLTANQIRKTAWQRSNER